MNRREGGFTLVEVYAVMVLVGVFAAVAFAVFQRGFDGQRAGDDAAGVVDRSMRVLQALEADLRTAERVDTTSVGELLLEGPDGFVIWSHAFGGLRRADAAGERERLDGVAEFEVEATDGRVEVVLWFAERRGSGTPPPLTVVVAPRAPGEIR